MKQKIPQAVFQNGGELAEGMENSSHHMCKDGRVAIMIFFLSLKWLNKRETAIDKKLTLKIMLTFQCM